MEKRDSKRQQLEKQGASWWDLPPDIVECINGHLHWTDRFRIRAVCKGWSVSVPIRHVPIIDGLPWAMTKFSWAVSDDGQIHVECRLFDFLSGEYYTDGSVKGKEGLVFLRARPCASVYGWLLFEVLEGTRTSLFLYSPFTTEVIKLPVLHERYAFQAATFSLNAASPKCVVFLLRVDNHRHRIHIKICSPHDYSWKNFEFNGFGASNWAFGATYVDGAFYCAFSKGELGAFNVEHEDWTLLTDGPLPKFFSTYNADFIASGADLLLLDRRDLTSLILYKFDFSEMRWVRMSNLNNHMIFIGCTSFSAQVVGETSLLRNNMFFSEIPYRVVRCDGSNTSASGGVSLLRRRCVEAGKCAIAWIDLPRGGFWRANDLIKAV